MMRRWLPVLPLLLVFVLAIHFDVHRHLTLDTLRDHRGELARLVAEHRLAAMLVFAAAYAAVTALSLPGAAIMTVGAGLAFGTPQGALVAVAGATTGATILFLIARSAFGGLLRQRAGPYLRRLESGFRSNAFNYLLFMRLVPVFPFWAVNLTAGLLHVSLRTFVLTTALGIIPGSVIYAAFGAGLDAAFTAGSEVTLADIFNPTLVAALTGLGLLALVPILLRRWRGS